MDTWVIYTFGSFENVVMNICTSFGVGEYFYSSWTYIYSGIGQLYSVKSLFLTIWGIARLFPVKAVLFHIPTAVCEGIIFFYILTNIIFSITSAFFLLTMFIFSFVWINHVS